MDHEDRPLRDRLGLPSSRLAIGTIVRLVVACLIVGTLLALFRVDPLQLWQDLFRWVRTGVVDLFGTGLDGINLVITLLLTGAVIVLPIWLISKLLNLGKR